MARASFTFRVRSYECGPDGFATLPSVCNYLQEAASLHAERLGFSKSNFAAAGENISWVLTKLVVRMARYPRWDEEVTVETFPRGGRRIVAWRDFEPKDAAGATLGVVSSEWMIIDLATRRIVTVPDAVFDATDPADVPLLGPEPFTRLRFPETPAGAPAPLVFTAQRAQIDLNGHVNNVHYIAWMLEPCASRRPGEMEIVFRSETLAGDEVRVATAEAPDGFTYHRVFAPDGKDHITARTRQ